MGAWLPSASWSSIFLLLLLGQNTSKTLLLRAAVHTSPRFLYSAAVLATEALKAMLAAAWVLSSGGSPRSILRFLRAEWRNFLRVMVPAGIYNCQQMLEFVALSRLEAPVFSVIVQTKLLTTALFSVLLLGKQLRAQQMIALVLLMVGVILAQMKGGQKTLLDVTPDAFIGASATLCIATLSGFAAVYTERVLKRGQLRAHTHAQDILGYMQIQMALASLLIIGMFAAIMDMPTILEVGLWHGFDRAACIAVVSSALGGLIVSAVLKYADSVLKGYATAASVILTGVLSSMFLGTTLDLHFMLAVINVTCSIALYSQVGVASAPVISPSETEPLARGA
ncbi:hypothetical protein AB1Y20_005717 [Prymnesium parvum]|uniref:CMP-sialic acid transporter n=1 Tax=Prymnesium parvum TaxID=97485 RepID=A0AB34J200_PRYPA